MENFLTTGTLLGGRDAGRSQCLRSSTCILAFRPSKSVWTMSDTFDFAKFKNAFEAKDAAGWAGCYADDVEWIEYRHQSPPRAPNIMRGKATVSAFIEGVCVKPVSFTIEDEIIVPGRAAFRLIVELGEGRRIIEHIMLYFENGKIKREVDVEAWD